MLYTDNVNKIIWQILLPILFIVFFSYIFIETYSLRQENKYSEDVIQKHLINLDSKTNLTGQEGLILGGSNSVFSLSAEILTELSSLNWYNLSLLNEGVSKENYFSFIDDNLDEEFRSQIKVIVYSSIVPFRKNLILDRKKSKRDIYGNPNYFRLPQKKLITFIKEKLEGSSNKSLNFPMPNKFGDFNFKEFSCIEKEKIKFEHEELSVAFEWTEDLLKTSKYLFPNAKIIFLYPSQFQPDKLEEDKGKKIFEGLSRELHKYDRSTFFYYQKQFASQNLICDDFHHANEKGRKFRTNDLYENALKNK